MPQGCSAPSPPLCLYNLFSFSTTPSATPFPDLPRFPIPAYISHTCLDYLPRLSILKACRKREGNGLPLVSTALSCELLPEAPPPGLFPAHQRSAAHPQSGVEGRPRSPSQECSGHSGSTAPHRRPWSARSSGRRCPHHTCSRPSGGRLLITGGQETKPVGASGCF